MKEEEEEEKGKRRLAYAFQEISQWPKRPKGDSNDHIAAQSHGREKVLAPSIGMFDVIEKQHGQGAGHHVHNESLN